MNLLVKRRLIEFQNVLEDHEFLDSEGEVVKSRELVHLTRIYISELEDEVQHLAYLADGSFIL
jgi:hypothetical protein